MVKRVLVTYCVDVDACAGCTANASDVSRGAFGANVRTDRVLKLFKDHDILASWYMPGHSILSCQAQMAKRLSYGYTHESVSRLTDDQEQKVMANSIEVYKELTGKHHKGRVASAWEISPRSMQIQQDFGIEYDHSMMHYDCQPYCVYDMPPTTVHTDYSKDPDDWVIPMPKHANESPMHFSIRNPGTHGFVNPRGIEVQWKDQFDFYGDYESFVFTIGCHPQVSGRSNIQLMHERLIPYLKSHEGVEFTTMAQICDEYKAGKIAGVTVTAGV
ncbi:glucose 1-dehydrogenase [Acephala macrosclerotiorum]|nr:glucose 1-dehydrogenase [Acephala macrosclerotiorum]